jgi:predicted ATPase
VTQSRAIQQNAPAVAQVCRRLEGIPLALELAAAQVPLLSVEQIAIRLDDPLGLLTHGRRLAPVHQMTRPWTPPSAG